MQKGSSCRTTCACVSPQSVPMGILHFSHSLLQWGPVGFAVLVRKPGRRGKRRTACGGALCRWLPFYAAAAIGGGHRPPHVQSSTPRFTAGRYAEKSTNVAVWLECELVCPISNQGRGPPFLFVVFLDNCWFAHHSVYPVCLIAEKPSGSMTFIVKRFVIHVPESVPPNVVVPEGSYACQRLGFAPILRGRLCTVFSPDLMSCSTAE